MLDYVDEKLDFVYSFHASYTLSKEIAVIILVMHYDDCWAPTLNIDLLNTS